MNNQVKEIFNYIQSLNPSKSEISSLGSFYSQSTQMVFDSIYRKCMSAISDDQSLAYKILRDGDIGKFSTKQLWVIAYELVKSDDFVKMVADFNEDVARNIARKSAKKAAKRTAKKEFAQKAADRAININACDNIDLVIGSNVKHPKFGIGTVISTDGKIGLVNFESEGEKKLVLAFAKLEVI